MRLKNRKKIKINQMLRIFTKGKKGLRISAKVVRIILYGNAVEYLVRSGTDEYFLRPYKGKRILWDPCKMLVDGREVHLLAGILDGRSSRKEIGQGKERKVITEKGAETIQQIQGGNGSMKTGQKIQYLFGKFPEKGRFDWPLFAVKALENGEVHYFRGLKIE